jgi:hypothetical protein
MVANEKDGEHEVQYSRVNAGAVPAVPAAGGGRSTRINPEVSIQSGDRFIGLDGRVHIRAGN